MSYAENRHAGVFISFVIIAVEFMEKFLFSGTKIQAVAVVVAEQPLPQR